MRVNLINFNGKRLPGRWHFELMTLWFNQHSGGMLVLKRGIEIVWHK